MADSELIRLYQELHRTPELSLEEFGTTARITEELASIDGVELLDLGTGTGALARITGGRPGATVALRADIDALPIEEQTGLPYSSERPGTMHACGHDFHTAALLGAARQIARGREGLAGSVVLLFQPAEEASRGGLSVVRAGALQPLGISRFFGLHVDPTLPAGTVAIPDGPLTAAVDRFEIAVRGRGCHAAHPEAGLDPIVAAARLVGSLQEVVSRAVSPLEPALLSVTHIEGGSTWNVIPDEVRLEGTARTFSPEARDVVEREVRARVGALGALGYETEVNWLRSAPSVVNDHALAEPLRQAARADGLELREIPPSTGGEDFSELYAVAPGVFAHVGVGGDYPLHSPHFSPDVSALDAAVRLHVLWATATLDELA